MFLGSKRNVSVSIMLLKDTTNLHLLFGALQIVMFINESFHVELIMQGKACKYDDV